MKTILTSLLILITIYTKAQFSVSTAIGYSNKMSPTVELKPQYTFNNIIISTGLLTHLSNSNIKGALFNIQSGYQFNMNHNTTLEPTIGYSYNLNSTDNKSLNKKGFITSIYFNKKIVTNGDFIIGMNITSYNVFIISTGIRYNF